MEGEREMVGERVVEVEREMVGERVVEVERVVEGERGGRSLGHREACGSEEENSYTGCSTEQATPSKRKSQSLPHMSASEEESKAESRG
ncbi:hypothetical protein scyTo_0007896 [Scyliorhinus torazame]|uniref:Uncharacterized protein n=1 Tax=Scyliorhinus torazame TaxID=75743 RepID=A0A401P089_SCYTO|nr:hypothetical protein [Scyliorhinus torazame]